MRQEFDIKYNVLAVILPVYHKVTNFNLVCHKPSK
jgi:hypothetical protein